MTSDNGCTVQQASELGWDADQRILAYRGRTIGTIEPCKSGDCYCVNYDCGQMDVLPGNRQLDIFVPLAVYKAVADEYNKTVEDINNGEY